MVSVKDVDTPCRARPLRYRLRYLGSASIKANIDAPKSAHPSSSRRSGPGYHHSANGPPQPSPDVHLVDARKSAQKGTMNEESFFRNHGPCRSCGARDATDGTIDLAGGSSDFGHFGAIGDVWRQLRCADRQPDFRSARLLQRPERV